MSRFFFDTDDGDRLIRDHDGYECRDREAARRMAVRALPDIASDVLPASDRDRRTMVVQVRDETGRYVFRATLELAAEWLDDGAPT